MRPPSRKQNGLGILAVIVCVAVLVTLVAVMTVSLATFSATSTRYARGVRARALAEAGVETALERLTSKEAGKLEPVRFELDGGSCLVEIKRAEGEPDRLTIVSSGRLRLSGGEVISRLTLVVRVPDDGKHIRILSRSEDTRYVRLSPEKKSSAKPG